MSEESEILREILETLRAQRGMTGVGSSAAEDLEEGLGEAAEAAEALAEAEAAAAEAAAKFAANMQSGLRNVGVALTSFGGALTTVTGKFNDFSQGLDSLSDAALDIGKNFGGAGIAIGLFTKAVTSVTSAAFKQTDALLEARADLTKLGGAGVGTAKDIAQMAHQARISSKNLEILVAPMKSLTGNFLALGSTVADGQKTFMKMTAISEDQRKAFGRLGLSQQEVIQSQADFVRLQRMSGVYMRGQEKDAKALQKASLEYTKNLVELAAISGNDLEGAKRAQEMVRMQMAENLRTTQESIKIKKLQDQADKETDPVRRKALIEQARTIEIEQKARHKMIDSVAAQTDEATALAYAQYMATGSINETVAPLIAQGNDLAEQRRRMLAAAGDEQKLNEAVGRNMQDLNTAYSNTVERFAYAAGMNEQTARAFNLNQARNAKLIEQQGRNEVTARQQVNQQVTQQMTAGMDPMADAQQNLLEVQRTLAVGLDQLLLKVNPLNSAYGTAIIAVGALTAAVGLASLALRGLSVGGAAGGLGSIFRGGRGGIPDDFVGPPDPRRAGALARAGGIARTVAGRAGIAAVGGLAGEGLQMAGDAIGGTTGKVVSGAGTVAQFAAIGAMLGPLGALTGGVVGLGKALYDNKEAILGSTDITRNSDEIKKQIEQREQERQNRLTESNQKLAQLLGDNNQAISMFSGRMATLTDEQFNRLITQLRESNQITEQQVSALKAQRAQEQTQAAKTAEAQKAADTDETTFKEIDASLKFTSEDEQRLASKKRDIETLKAKYKQAKSAEEKEIINSAITTLKQDETTLENKKKVEQDYLAKEKTRVAKAIETQRKRDETLRILAQTREESQLIEQELLGSDQARLESEKKRIDKLVRDYEYSIRIGKQSITSVPAALIARVQAEQKRVAAAGGGAGGGASGRETLPQSRATGPGGRVLEIDDLFKFTGGTGSQAHFNKLDSTFQTSLINMAADYHKLTGKQLQVNSAYRSPEEQARISSGSNPKAAPGYSKHNIGMAVDLNSNETAFLENQGLLSKYGFKSGREFNDPPHIYMAEGGIAEGPTSGFPATLHGKEMVIPLNGDSLLEKLGTMSEAQLSNETSGSSVKMEALFQNLAEMNQRTTSEWINRLDRVLDVLENSRTTQEKTLRAIRL